ncbi:P-loop containing nucleoside triphosphate hydrolase protein [Daedalea quercina L-15889]|uniref:Guanine nucleotide-binding protein-like 1 n=1 Tax=Daedalea quercina L-15889 TaxID=1314783 RepID=A0A165UKM0_9APHY|nr:P-loop containing nucleoside triphosphate hydrolase protein [Daedalea quercina L-15889]
MPPRKKPFSAKQKKEQLQLKRAVKRGDAEPPPKLDRHGRPQKKRSSLGNRDHEASSPAAVASLRLESSFVKLSGDFLNDTRKLASELPLTRPIAPHTAIWRGVSDGSAGAANSPLTCPKRPKWRYDMSKKEVEANEEGLFRKWLAQTDAAVNQWASSMNQPDPDDPAPTAKMPSAPTSYERNLEVWRQLWRVTEISQIILILLDSRCPLLHYPPALSSYLAGLPHASRTRIILVLTKVDIVGPARADAWAAYLRGQFPGTRVVQVESYAEADGAPAPVQGRKKAPDAHLPSAFRRTLVAALRDAHAELLAPPEYVQSDAAKLARWRPRVRREVNWDVVLEAEGERVGSVVGGSAAPRPGTRPHAEETQQADDREGPPPEDEGGGGTDDEEPEFLTMGLIGQPNVGKSSLLNALFGQHKVKASRTPGKTKHFQTLFWTPEVRLVDCPGLVMPNFVPMETQVLAAILPISRVSAVALCTHHAAQLLPLERILQLAHPALTSPPPEDRRTWRAGMRAGAKGGGTAQAQAWTAMDVLTAYALRKGWVTAKAGRPDVGRAGNASELVLSFRVCGRGADAFVGCATVLRALAEGRIRWAFWPPGTDPRVVEEQQGGVDAAGIWIPDLDDAHHDVDVESEDDGTAESDGDDSKSAATEDETEDEEDAADAIPTLGGASSRFAALTMEGDADDSGN